MCGRFALQNPEEIAGHFNINKISFLEPRYNSALSKNIAAIRLNSHTPEREFSLLRWGLIPFWTKDKNIGYKMINAKSEIVTGKPAFRGAFKYRRCLIPATGFYEWSHKVPKKQPYFIRLKNSNILSFAGLWEHWTGNNNEIVESCTIITTVANETVGNIHDRMPVLIGTNLYDTWLDPAAEGKDLLPLLVPFPDEKCMPTQWG